MHKQCYVSTFVVGVDFIINFIGADVAWNMLRWRSYQVSLYSVTDSCLVPFAFCVWLKTQRRCVENKSISLRWIFQRLAMTIKHTLHTHPHTKHATASTSHERSTHSTKAPETPKVEACLNLWAITSAKHGTLSGTMRSRAHDCSQTFRLLLTLV